VHVLSKTKLVKLAKVDHYLSAGHVKKKSVCENILGTNVLKTELLVLRSIILQKVMKSELKKTN